MSIFLLFLIYINIFFILYLNVYINHITNIYNVYVVLTVFMRNNLLKQLDLVSRQSIRKSYSIHIIVFQSGLYNNISNVINIWRNNHKFNVTYIHSTIETGFYGRFLAPLVSYTTENSYFIIVDDDVMWGDKYFENMIRVVNSNSLAVRMGRLINRNYVEIIVERMRKLIPVTYNEDIEYDYGGHMWAGKMKWIRDLWKHPPPTIETSEDFWISAVLKVYYNITTKKPMCRSSKIPIKPDYCACSDSTQNPLKHEPLHLGGKIINESRRNAIKTIKNTYNVPLLLETNHNIIENIRNMYSYNTTFITKGNYMEKCLYFV